MPKIGKTEIEQLISISGLKGYTGEFSKLGGGELNDTFLLSCDPDPVVLRVAKYPNQNGLKREAMALSLLASNHVPKLLFFDINNLILDRHWILESYVQGTTVSRLSLKQFESLGALLAQVHTIQNIEKKLNFWETFLRNSKRFGDEKFLLNHPDERLRILVNKARTLFEDLQPKYSDVCMSLVHGDVTPSNTLVNGDKVALIDWEFSSYGDPMAEFSTIYYEDIEYNQGKWRIQIKPEEKTALFNGYTRSGGRIDEDRVKLWMNQDKLGAAKFLYWRIHDSGRKAEDSQIKQYKVDLENLTKSLEKNLE